MPPLQGLAGDAVTGPVLTYEQVRILAKAIYEGRVVTSAQFKNLEEVVRFFGRENLYDLNRSFVRGANITLICSTPQATHITLINKVDHARLLDEYQRIKEHTHG